MSIGMGKLVVHGEMEDLLALKEYLSNEQHRLDQKRNRTDKDQRRMELMRRVLRGMTIGTEG